MALLVSQEISKRRTLIPVKIVICVSEYLKFTPKIHNYLKKEKIRSGIQI